MKLNIKKYYRNFYFFPYKPVVLARIIGNYIRMPVLRKTLLRVVTVALSYECQFFCQHCSADSLRTAKSGQESLTLDDFERIFRQAEHCGAINIHFTGGEPLLSGKIYDIANLARPKRNILSIATNGLLLSQEADNLYKAGFDLAIVSIDSPYPEIHDTLRQYDGAYVKAWEGVEAALKSGLKVMVAMVATPQNLYNGEIDEQMKLCRKLKIPLQLLPARNIGKWQNKEDIIFTEDDQKAFYRYTAEPDVRWDGQSSYFTDRCLAARERIYIDPAGNIFACDFIHKPFGNVRKESIFDIRQRMLSQKPFDAKPAACLSAFGKEAKIYQC
jgi:AdoMet-dependent heme synthase